MPRRGVKPTEGPKRFRGRALTEWTEVEDTPYTGPSPELPDDVLWPRQTRRWYETVRHLPHAVLWDEGEWEEILTTALLHAAIWRSPAKPSSSLVNELRQREKAIGLTLDQRVDLRIKYVPVREPEPEEEDDNPEGAVVITLRPRSDALET